MILLSMVLCLFAISLASARCWQTIYETDFSTDPGWTTNNPAYFYWDGTDSTYFACQYNVNNGGYYTGYNAGYDGGSILLEFEIIVESEQYCSDLSFGMFDSDFVTDRESYFRLGFTHNDQDLHTFLSWCNADSTCGYASDTTAQWVLGSKYRVALEYNADDNTLMVDIRNEDGSPFTNYTATGVGPFNSDMGNVGSSNVRVGNFGCPENVSTCGRFDKVKYSLEASSLIIPSVSVLPCDAQPVIVDVQDSIRGIAIPLKKEYGVQIRKRSMVGLPTENWYVTFEEQTDTTFFIHFQDTSGAGLPPGQHTVLNLYVQPECTTSTFIYWDTAFSDDVFRTLAFTNMQYQTIYPAFVPDPSPTEIVGYVPGDVDGSGAVDISDLVYMVDYMFTGGPPPCVMDAFDVSGDCIGDISDLVYKVDYMFTGGVELQCGCISAGALAKVAVHPEIVMTTNVDNGMTTISLTAPFDLRALDLTLAGPDGAAPVTLLGDDLDMVYGQEGERVKIGILDLDGANVIPAGENRVIQIAGEYEVVSAVVATDGYHTYAATIGEAAKGGSLPSEYALSQNYPNPFNPRTTISFSLPVASHVSLEIYNVMGQRVTTVADGFYEAGVHACEWDGSAVASGVYFYRIETPEFVETKKMMLLK